VRLPAQHLDRESAAVLGGHDGCLVSCIFNLPFVPISELRFFERKLREGFRI